MIEKEDLKNFEKRVVTLYEATQIRSPIHLSSGNEDILIEIFKLINQKDWVLCSWRSHYHCLLKGVPEVELMNSIISGKSISLCFPEYRIYSSAIVGGILPIAVGIAIGIQRRKSQEKVYCFIGDMTAETGIAHESIKYSRNHNLPIRFIVEDNGISVSTPTCEVWGQQKSSFANESTESNIIYYQYKNEYPHSGTGVFLNF